MVRDAVKTPQGGTPQTGLSAVLLTTAVWACEGPVLRRLSIAPPDVEACAPSGGTAKPRDGAQKKRKPAQDSPWPLCGDCDIIVARDGFVDQ